MKTSVYIACSLDGFIAREDGALDWLPGSDGRDSDTGEDYGFHAFMDGIDTLVMGRNTYELVLSFGPWPYAGKRVVVLSNTLERLADGLPDTVELSAGAPHALIAALEASGARHAYIDGGKTLQGFLNAGLIDELIITRVPVLIGSGIALFGALDNDIPLQHLETRTFDNGFVQSRYAVNNATRPHTTLKGERRARPA